MKWVKSDLGRQTSLNGGVSIIITINFIAGWLSNERTMCSFFLLCLMFWSPTHLICVSVTVSVVCLSNFVCFCLQVRLNSLQTRLNPAVAAAKLNDDDNFVNFCVLSGLSFRYYAAFCMLLLSLLSVVSFNLVFIYYILYHV